MPFLSKFSSFYDPAFFVFRISLGDISKYSILPQNLVFFKFNKCAISQYFLSRFNT